MEGPREYHTKSDGERYVLYNLYVEALKNDTNELFTNQTHSLGKQNLWLPKETVVVGGR